MNHNRIPDNDDMARLIATAFDALPGPDEERLEATRTRLETQIKRPPSRSHGKRWIWLLLLAGGVATANWWAAEYVNNQNETVETSPPVQPNKDTVQSTTPAPVKVQPSEGNRNEQPEHGNDSIIYQREQR